MKRYLYSRYFVHYELDSVRCSMVVNYKQAEITNSVLIEMSKHLGGNDGDKAFIVNISKVS